MTRTPVIDSRLAELYRLADDAKRRRHSAEISYRMSIVGWLVMRELKIEQFARWLASVFERGRS